MAKHVKTLKCNKIIAKDKADEILQQLRAANYGIGMNTTEFVPVDDNVNHPSHYETGKFECIDVMVETQGVEAVKNFCICNAFKYLYRHNNKNGVEDIKKAIWYLNKFIELEESGGES